MAVRRARDGRVAPMLLAVDVGNTQTVLGLYRDEELVEQFRLATDRERTGDELGVTLGGSVRPRGRRRHLPLVDRAGARARVGARRPALAEGAAARARARRRRRASRSATTIRARSGRTGSRTPSPALERYGAPCIVVDFGTSTNFDVVSPEGEYVGGVLAPGIEISMDALFARAARLVKVDFVAPAGVIGKTTVGGLQSGLVYGFAGQVDGIVRPDPRGARRRRADRRHRRARRPDRAAPADARPVDPFLTLEGLRLVWLRNR